MLPPAEKPSFLKYCHSTDKHGPLHRRLGNITIIICLGQIFIANSAKQHSIGDCNDSVSLLLSRATQTLIPFLSCSLPLINRAKWLELKKQFNPFFAKGRTLGALSAVFSAPRVKQLQSDRRVAQAKQLRLDGIKQKEGGKMRQLWVKCVPPRLSVPCVYKCRLLNRAL